MIIQNRIIEVLTYEELGNDAHCHIVNSIVKKIDFISFEANFQIIIEKCLINDLLIHSCWFREGLLFTGNYVSNFVDYQMGGHNRKPIVIKGNIFESFFNFFDCLFSAEVIVMNNVFTKGTNLLGNMNTGFKNQFDKDATISDNVGSVNLDVT